MARESQFFYLGRAIWRSLAMVGVLLMLYVIMGRQVAPMINRTAPAVEQFLSTWLQQPVRIGSVQGEWRGFGPVFTVRDVAIGEQFALDTLVLEPALIASLVKQDIIFFRLSATGASIDVSYEDDRWTVPAFSAFESDTRVRRSLLQIYDQLLAQDSLQLRNIRINLLKDTQRFDVLLADVFILSSPDQHAARGDVVLDPDGQAVPAAIQVEARNIRATPDFSIYLEHDLFDLPAVLNLAGGTADWPIDATRLAVSGAWWAEWQGGEWQEIHAEIDQGDAAFRFVGDAASVAQQQIEAFSAALHWAPRNGAQYLQLEDLTFTYNDRLWPLSRYELTLDGQQTLITASEINVATLGALLTDWTGTPLFDRHEISGTVTDVQVQIPQQVDVLRWQDTRLTGVLTEGYFGPFGGYPGIEGIKGRFTATPRGGVLQSQAGDWRVDIPEVLPSVLELNVEAGEFAWRVGEGSVLNIASGPLSMLWRDVGRLQGQLATTVDLSAQPRLTESVFALSLAGERLDTEALNDALPMNLDPAVQRWIRTNIHYLEAEDWAVILPNTFSPDPKVQAGVLLADVQRASVRFDPSWPDVANATGQFFMDHRGLSVALQAAELGGLRLANGDLNMPFSVGPRWVHINTPVAGSAQDAWRLVTDSPLHSLLNDTIRQWDVSGEIAGHLSLNVPLAEADIYADIALDVRQGRLVLPEQALAISDISGPLFVSTEQGVRGLGLQGKFFDQLTQFDVATQVHDGAWNFSIHADGDLPVDTFGAWLDDPVLSGMPGIVPYTANITFLDGWPQFELSSSLQGLEIPLPAPVGKQAEETRALALTLGLGDTHQVAFTYGNDVVGQLIVANDWSLDSAVFGVGEVPRPLQSGRILADIRVPDLDADAWWIEIQRFRTLFSSNDDGLPLAGPSMRADVNLQAASATLLQQQFNDFTVVLNNSADGLTAEVRANEVRGILGLSGEPGEPLILILDYLSLQTAQRPEDEPPPPYAYDPEDDPFYDYAAQDIPPMQIELRRLLVNDLDYGYWSFNVENDADSVRVSDLNGLVRFLEVTGDMEWRFAEQQRQSTHLNLNIRGGNINRFLTASGFTPIADSQSVRATADVSWPGSPLYFAGLGLVGSVDFDLRNGAIYELEEFDSIKLIGLMNVTRIFRRLSLDFRDVLNAGFSYDQIAGDLVLNQGVVSVGDRLLLDGSGAKMFFNGSYDVPTDQLDAEGVVIARVTNAAGLVALGAGVTPPLALLVIFGERAFERELERLFSVRTEISGSLRDPNVTATRLFDSNIRGNDATIEERVRELFGPESRP